MNTIQTTFPKDIFMFNSRLGDFFYMKEIENYENIGICKNVIFFGWVRDFVKSPMFWNIIPDCIYYPVPTPFFKNKTTPEKEAEIFLTYLANFYTDKEKRAYILSLHGKSKIVFYKVIHKVYI